MTSFGYISAAVKEIILQILLFFDSFDYSAVFSEGNIAIIVNMYYYLQACTLRKLN